MPGIVSNRLTSENLVIEWTPLSLTPATHIQHLLFHADIASGTFSLWVNGVSTGDITITGTPATDIASINTALDAVTPAPADLVASGTVLTDITITAAAEGFWIIALEDITQLVGNTSTDPNLQTTITTQGSEVFVLSGEMSAFSYEESANSQDGTAMSGYDMVEYPTGRDVSWDASVFRKPGDLDWERSLVSGYWGVISVYPEGKIAGKDWLSMQVFIDSVSEPYASQTLVEKDISGKRQGAYIVPPRTIYS